MLSESPGPRISTLTTRQLLARNTAAWPAELAPPTTMTSSSLQTDEAREVGQRQLAILGAASDNDGAATHGVAVRQFELVRTPIAAQAYRTVADFHVNTKLLCLVEGARSERAPGNTSGKSEIILDLRA